MPFKNKKRDSEWRSTPEFKVKEKWWSWRKKYRGSKQEYEHYLECKNCECCNTPFGGLRHKKCQDHDHDTGQLRGVICAACNMIEGYSTDNRERLIAVYQYCLPQPKIVKKKV